MSFISSTWSWTTLKFWMIRKHFYLVCFMNVYLTSEKKRVINITLVCLQWPILCLKANPRKTFRSLSLFLFKPLLLHLYQNLLSLSSFNVRSCFFLLYLQFFVIQINRKVETLVQWILCSCHIDSTINHLLYLFYIFLLIHTFFLKCLKIHFRQCILSPLNSSKWVNCVT